jgi:hypothetical protein
MPDCAGMSFKPKGCTMTFPWRKALRGPECVMGMGAPRLRKAITQHTSSKLPVSSPVPPDRSNKGSSGQMLLLATHMRKLYRRELDPVTRLGSRLRSMTAELREGPAAVCRRYTTLAYGDIQRRTAALNPAQSFVRFAIGTPICPFLCQSNVSP